MNICFLTSRFPFPEIGGDSLRINHVAQYLKSIGHRIVLVSFWGEKTPDIEAARSLFDEVCMVRWSSVEAIWYSLYGLIRKKPIQVGYYYSPRMLKRIRQLCQKEDIDLYIPHAMRMTEYVAKLGYEKKTIVEQTDAISKTYLLSKGGKGNIIKSFIYRIESKVVPHYEEYMLRTFPKVVYVSPSDVAYLQDKYPMHRSAVCHTNGFDLPEKITDMFNPHKICLMGNMRTLQNQDAALFFTKEVLPLIIKEEPQTIFYIVGAEPSKQIQELASEHVIVTGFVDKVEEEIADACFCVAPVRIAAGIQNKVLVSLGCGVPVILSSLISQPIPELKDGVNCFIADDASNIAKKCILLMRDNKLREAIGGEGREMIRKNYSWDKTLEGYEIINR